MDVAFDKADDTVHVDDAKADIVDGAEFVLVLRDEIGAHDGPGGGDFEHPGVPEPHRPLFAGDVFELRSPAFANFGIEVEVAEGEINHDIQEFGFAGKIGIERHGRDTKFFGDATHGDGRKALGIGDGDCAAGDFLPRKAELRPPLRLFRAAPEQVYGALWVAAAAVFGWHWGIVAPLATLDNVRSYAWRGYSVRRTGFFQRPSLT